MIPGQGPTPPTASDEVHYIPFEGGYKCKHCSYCAPHRNLVVRHARTHTGERPYGCNYCQYRSSRLDNMRTHSYKCAEKRQKRNLGVMKGLNNPHNPTLSGLLSTPVLTVSVDKSRRELEYEQPSLSILPLPQDLNDAVLPSIEGLQYED